MSANLLVGIAFSYSIKSSFPGQRGQYHTVELWTSESLPHLQHLANKWRIADNEYREAGKYLFKPYGWFMRWWLRRAQRAALARKMRLEKKIKRYLVSLFEQNKYGEMTVSYSRSEARIISKHDAWDLAKGLTSWDLLWCTVRGISAPETAAVSA